MKQLLLSVLLVTVLYFCVCAQKQEAVDSTNDMWSSVDQVLLNAINDKAAPGIAAMVGNRNGILYKKAFGYHTYPSAAQLDGRVAPPTPVSFETVWDMASVTKVLTTTMAIAQFWERKQLDLDMKISTIFPEFVQQGKAGVSVKNCLLHNAGFLPDPVPNFNMPEFGCPESRQFHPELQFDCQEMFYNYVMTMPLKYAPGTDYVYSDLSMITLMYVVGYLARTYKYITYADVAKYSNCPVNGQGRGELQCFFHAYINKYIFEALGMKNTKFVTRQTDVENMRKISPPGWNETELFRHEVVSGYVSDENAYIMGGVAGHAGMFTTLNDIEKIMRAILFQQVPSGVSFLKESTVDYFGTCYNLTQSSRALGFDTMMDGVGSCGTLSPSTFLHLGYSGTQVCFDKERKLFTVLLSNRCYPDKLNNKIGQVRVRYNTAVQKVVDFKTERLFRNKFN